MYSSSSPAASPFCRQPAREKSAHTTHSTPSKAEILFIIFANPDTTARVFESIRQVQPAKLYVAADAPRPEKKGEDLRCEETRNIIRRIDWDCEVKTLFQDKNLGPKIAVSTAITWFFEHEEQGVILEHDCLPDPSFFPYCKELLNRYKDDTRIGHICGSNFCPDVIDDRFSYDFSAYSHIWGWATWRRAWKNYDVDLKFWNECKNKRTFLFCNLWDKIYFSSFISDAVHNRNGIYTWDTQWLFTLRSQNQLSISPVVNMVTNIGIGDPNAVHTAKIANKYISEVKAISFPLRHPHYILRNKRLDKQCKSFSWKRLFRYVFGLY